MNEKRNIVKEIRGTLFSNPVKGLKSYAKRVRMFFGLSFIQFRNPACHLVGSEKEFLKEEVPQGKGFIFPVLFRILNPLGGAKDEKIIKFHVNYINYAKECISLLVAAVLTQLAFMEFAGKETAGNMEVALFNSIVLFVFYISILIYGIIARILTRKINYLRLKYLVQEAFIYEICMIFGIVVFITMLNAFGVIDLGAADKGGGVLVLVCAFFIPLLHPYYMLLAINKKVKLTSFFGVIGWGFFLGIVGSFTLLTALGIAMKMSGIE
jgi:hypothetical protein